MPDNHGFVHLSLPMILQGKPKLRGGGTPSQTTSRNRENRINHGAYIKQRAGELSRFWTERRTDCMNQKMPDIETGIPLLLEIDPSSDIDFLRGLGFEIVCEIQEGFIIVATDDVDLNVLNMKADDFIANIKVRCNTPAKVYALCEDTDRLQRILSQPLYEKWANINDSFIYSIDIGVGCSGNTELPDMPKRNDAESDEHYNQRLENWQRKFGSAYMVWDELKMQREEIIERFVQAYEGEIVQFIDGSSSIVGLPDSFSARLRINGKCLRDLVLNFAYIFEVSESEEINMGASQDNTQQIEYETEILSPDDGAPVLCVVDSGIQEEHKYVAPAICAQDSRCMVPNSTNVNDEVNYGGHGTRVAGAILYPSTIPIAGTHKLPCWLRNIRVLDKDNNMPMDIYPPKVIEAIVREFSKEAGNPTKTYNHSIGANRSCELKHMSAWAAEIDMQSYDADVLFVQAAGNIRRDIITAYIQAGHEYPTYLDRELSRICDPAQSFQALTVGSVSMDDYETDDYIVIGRKEEIAAFSRSGPGIWDVIKPEVVEYGGTYVKNKVGTALALITPEEICPELIRRSPEGPAFSRDAVGTSFAAPKVSHIAAVIEKLFPDSPALLYRALIVQSARWPDYSKNFNDDEKLELFRHIGFGIPNIDRATHNDDYRVTLVTQSLLEVGEDEAHIFSVPIPEQLRSVGEDYDILLEITLSYAAKPRRTRRYTKGYLSSWADWCCSRIGESRETFSRRIFQTGASIQDDGNFKWMLDEATDRGMIKGFSRKNGTIQKDWCILKSNQLNDAFCIAVRGHKGWGSLFKAKYSLVVSFEAISQDIEIYEPIRSMIEVEVENQEIEVEMKEEMR